jgi:glycosyltransferase involved in cell wall biosynthesis
LIERDPFVSLIITTYNWPEALAAVLESVSRQRIGPKEVLVADDGSGDATRKVVGRYQASLPFPVLHIWQEDRAFRAAAARNKALARSSGTRVVFIDGDVILHSEFVASHQAFARRGEYVQGSRSPLDARRSATMLENPRGPPHWSQRGVRRLQNAVHAPWLSGLVRSARDGCTGTRSCNLGVWRADAMRVNGFDERYEGWGREDTDFCWRLIHSGVRRRDLKFAAVQFHLKHVKLSRAAEPDHEARLAEVVREHRVWAERGVDQYEQPSSPRSASPVDTRASGTDWRPER